jgi:hypothetical protein
MELVLVTKNNILNNGKGYVRILRQALKQIKPGDTKNVIQVILNKNESYDTLKSAWRFICRKDNKQARTKLYNHELGKTVWLWQDDKHENTNKQKPHA